MSQNTRLAPDFNELIFDVANGVSISEGDCVAVNSGGYAEPGAESARLVTGVGDALVAAPNGSGIDGALQVKVGTNRPILFDVSGSVTNADIGKMMVLTSDATKLSVSGAVAGNLNIPAGGRLVQMDPLGTGKAMVLFNPEQDDS